MDKLYDLKEMLCEELKEYGSKGQLDVGGLEIVDKLAHAIKNLDRIIETYEEEEGGMSMRGSYYSREGQGGQGGGQGGSSRRGGSYARGGQGRGQNARRDSMGRYSRRGGSYEGYSRAADDMVEELRNLMEDAPDDKTRREIEKLVEKLEQM